MRSGTAVFGPTWAEDIDAVILAALPEIIGGILFSETHG